MRSILLALAIVIVLAFASTAGADNYGTNSAQYAKSKAMVMKTFGPKYGPTMVRCMNRESGGNPHASNWGDSNGGSFGLLQLNGAHRWRSETMAQFRARMWNPVTHLIAAKRLFDSSGFGPWGGWC
jgi:SLT domain-containing protein